MKNIIVNNLFEFWEHIGACTQSLHSTDQYNYVKSINNSWPSKVFRLSHSQPKLKELYQKVEECQIPNSISILENDTIETQLLESKFMLKSTVKGMYLDLHLKDEPIHNVTSIVEVDNEEKAIVFSNIASASFGYEVHTSTIIALIDSQKLKLYIGNKDNDFVSCGMLFLDDDGVSGLQMIGTIPEYRGLGLGKIMTNKLLLEAFKNQSDKVVLVASKSGERIYSKMGFITDGSLKSYS